MILILSRSKNEETTDEVIEWLDYLKEDYYRLNGEDLIEDDSKIEFDNESNNKDSNHIFTKFASADVIWNRRWFEFGEIQYFEDITPLTATRYNSHIRNELNILNGFIFHNFRNKKWVDYYPLIFVNKLKVNELAIKVGLNVPHILITNNKNDVLSGVIPI